MLGLKVPELVFVEVDAALGRTEPDEEVRNLLRASVGLNLALDYLPGSVMFDPAAGDRTNADLASRAVWFDSFITNVDRTPRNPNLLCWHKSLYFIDHGAALYFHHNWNRRDLDRMAATRFAPIRDHVLLPWADRIAEADAALRPLLTEEALARIVGCVPDEWLPSVPEAETSGEKRLAYMQYFLRRLQAAPDFVGEAERARSDLL